MKVIKSRLDHELPSEKGNISLELLSAFKKHANRTLLVDSRKQVEYTGADLLDKCSRIATSLVKKLGLKVDELLLFATEHDDEEQILLLSGILAGGSILGTYHVSLEELKIYTELCEPRILVTNAAQYAKVIQLKKLFPNCKIILVNQTLDNGQKPDGWPDADPTYLTFEQMLEGDRDDELIEELSKNKIDSRKHCSFRMMTSGSSGKPKMVPWTHWMQLNSIYSWITATKKQDGRPSPLLPIESDDVLAGDMPIDQGSGNDTIVFSIVIGAKLILMNPFDANFYWHCVDRYKITASITSASFTYKLIARLKSLIDSGETKSLDLSSMRYIGSTGTKLSCLDLIDQVRKVYPQLGMSQMYGATEIGFISMLPVEETGQHLDSAGYLMPDVQAKVVDLETGCSVGPNEKGELMIWSPRLFERYLIHQSESFSKVMAKAIGEDGFYHTGDLVYYDQDERFHVLGRIVDTLYLMTDWKVLPQDLEKIINQHPLVDQSAVVGVPDPEVPGCDVARAFIKLKNFEDLESEDLKEGELGRKLAENDLDFVKKHIYQFHAARTAAEKALKGGIRFLDSLPTIGDLEKLDRKAMRQMA